MSGEIGHTINEELTIACKEKSIRILEIQKNHGSFSKWLDKNQTSEIDLWVKLFKQNFKFTGGEITKEFLFSTGYLKGAHIETCPIYKKLNNLNPKWKNNYRQKINTCCE